MALLVQLVLGQPVLLVPVLLEPLEPPESARQALRELQVQV